MGLRESERFEYIRQPHILALLCLGILVIGFAVYTAVSRVQDRQRRASLPVAEACIELVGDTELCHFAAASVTAGDKPYTSVATEVTNTGGTIMTTIKSENPNRLSSVTQADGQEIEAFVLLEADSYVRDYKDGGIWAHYHDEAYEPSEPITAYDFSSSTSPDVAEFRDQYEQVGQEPCGEYTCLKYAIQFEEGGSQTFIWFDTTEFLLRRHQLTDEAGTQTTNYTYDPVDLTAPSPTKEVDEETLAELLGVE